jgi:hypothetical protein
MRDEYTQEIGRLNERLESYIEKCKYYESKNNILNENNNMGNLFASRSSTNVDCFN